MRSGKITILKLLKALGYNIFIMEEYRNAIEEYEVSNFGNIRKKLKNGNYKAIEGSIQNRGYRYFQLIREGKRINYLIHHLVAKHFIEERPESLVIDHIDRNKLNNHVSNLRYVSQGNNCKNQDRYIVDIEETEPKKRHSLVCKRYVELNRDNVLTNKKEYYKKNRDILLEKMKNKEKIKVTCSICKNERQVSYCMFNMIKRKGINNNICRSCSSIKNLEKIGN